MDVHSVCAYSLEYLEPKQKSTISTEIEPGKYAVGKFIFEKQGDIFKCMTCLRTADKKGTMIKHVRRHNNSKFDNRIKDLQSYNFSLKVKL